MKPSTLTACSSAAELLKIDLLEGSNYLKRKGMHLGFSTGEYLCHIVRQDVANLNSVVTFKKEAREMIKVIMQAILEKSPLHSVVVKNANVFDPKSIITLPADSLRRNTKSLLRYIVSLKIISTSIAEKALSQYSNLILTKLQLDADKFRSFNSGKERLDDFIFKWFSVTIPAELKSILKLVLVLSHSQVSIERGFNVNKTFLKVNMNEKVCGRKENYH